MYCIFENRYIGTCVYTYILVINICILHSKTYQIDLFKINKTNVTNTYCLVTHGIHCFLEKQYHMLNLWLIVEGHVGNYCFTLFLTRQSSIYIYILSICL